ncbi:MAG: hypothetical protein GQ582_12300 [Methyloprofundus sp.]|nr:hypothetical protein [Methyloprofundus sp.]
MNAPVHREPSLYVLSVGISHYKDPSFNLKYADVDALDFSMTLKKRGINLYKKVPVRTLMNQEATLTRISEEIEAIAQLAQPQDVFVFYLAGHGRVLDGRYHFIPYDLIYENEGSLKQALSEAKLKALIASVETSKRMMVIDSCHAGQAIPALAMLSTRGIEDKTAINRLMNATGITILAAASKNQQAHEMVIDNTGHGLFTHALLKGLKGAADSGNKDKQIDVEELITYTREQVPALSLKYLQYEQFPMFQSPQQNFPIGILAK